MANAFLILHNYVWCNIDVEDTGEEEPASALLWTYYFLAQHFDHLGNTQKALDYINLAIYHTPTLIELFVTKGRIYKVRLLKFQINTNENFYLSEL